MRNYTKLLALTLCALFFTACSPDSRDSNGNAIKVSKYHGKWVIVNYWATWCASCLEEMPMLEAFAKAHPQDVVVLGVSFDPLTNEDMNAIAEKYSLSYPLLASFPIQKYSGESADILPLTFILNREGKLVKTFKGPLEEKELEKTLGLIPPKAPEVKAA